MKRAIVLAILAVVAAAHAASTISTPRLGDYVKSQRPLVLNTSVASSDTPGSSDFSEAAHTGINLTAASAFYASIDGAYARAKLMKESPVTNQVCLTVATNALFNYGVFLDLRNAFRTGSGPFNFSKNHTSTRFDSVYGFGVNFTWQSTIDLSQWRKMADLYSLDRDAIFQLDRSHQTAHSASYQLWDMASALCRGEYLPGATQTLPDTLKAFGEPAMNYTFNDLISSAFTNNYSAYMTNTSWGLSWKPICAFDQALSLVDASFIGSSYGVSYTNCNNAYHHRSAYFEDCGTAEIKIGSDGSLEVLSSSVSPDDFTVTTNDEESCSYFYASPRIYVSQVRHHPSVSGSLALDDAGASVTTEEIINTVFHGFPNTNEVDLVVWYSFSFSWPKAYATISATSTNEGAVATFSATMEAGDIEDMAGENEVDLHGRVYASYNVLETDLSHYRHTPFSSIWTSDYVSMISACLMSSYAVSTNNAPFAADAGNYNFGYDPNVSTNKPSPRDTSQRWGYYAATRNASYGSADSTIVSAQRTVDVSGMAKMKDEMTGVVGDFTDANVYMAFTGSQMSSELEQFYVTGARFAVGSGAVTNFVHVTLQYNEGVPDFQPEEVSASATISVVAELSHPSSLDDDCIIHPAIGGDMEDTYLIRTSLKFPSVERADHE